MIPKTLTSRKLMVLTFFSFFLSRRWRFRSSSSCCCFIIRSSRSEGEMNQIFQQSTEQQTINGLRKSLIKISNCYFQSFKVSPCSVKLPATFRFLRSSNRSFTWISFKNPVSNIQYTIPPWICRKHRQYLRLIKWYSSPKDEAFFFSVSVSPNIL